MNNMKPIIRNLTIIIILLFIHLKSSAQNTKDSNYYYYLGKSYYEKYKFDEAIYWFDRSIEKGYQLPKSYLFKAASEIFSFDLNKIKEAAANLNIATSLDSSDPNLFFIKGTYFKVIKNFDSSFFYFGRALHVMPLDAVCNDAIAIAFTEANKPDSAMKYEEIAIKVMPHNAGYINNLGIIERNMGKYEDAILRFKLALKYELNDLVTRTNIAYCKYKLKKYDEALRICNSVILDGPVYQYPYLVRGQIYFDIGQKEKACADFRQLSLLSAGKQLGETYFKNCGCDSIGIYK